MVEHYGYCSKEVKAWVESMVAAVGSNGDGGARMEVRDD